MTSRLGLLVNSPSKGTYANVVSRLAVGLAETGRVETTLVCYGDDPAPPWLPSEIRIFRLGTTRASRSVPALVSYLRSAQPDVLISRQVHGNLVGLAAAALARVRSGWRGKIVVAHDHPVELAHASDWRDNKWLVRVGYPFADGIIADSPTVRDDVIRWCRLDESSVVVVPIPIVPFSGEVDDVPHPWLREGPPVFVTTANLVAWKRIDLLLEAFHDLLARHDARLLIIGEGPERRRLTEYIRTLGLTGRAESLGWVSDPREFAAAACALVLPSEEEGFAQVLTEAMSVGCPVIAADALGGGPRYVTDNGHYGVLVPRGDRPALVQAMESMLQPDVRDRYSRLGLKRIEAFSPLSCADVLLDYLESLGVTNQKR
ncbi:MAG: glycosyltransferase [Actinomycetota bacterium]|nr:glycosyltransferase [Actinomycetota bacterium]